MRVIRFDFIVGVAVFSIISLLRDRATYNPIRLFSSVAALRHSPFLTRAVVRRIFTYTKPGFHPNDTDNSARIDYWTAALFGGQGSLVDHLH